MYDWSTWHMKEERIFKAMTLRAIKFILTKHIHILSLEHSHDKAMVYEMHTRSVMDLL